MYRNFKEQDIEYVRQAAQKDNADKSQLGQVFPLYMNALNSFRNHLKYENKPKIKEAITQNSQSTWEEWRNVAIEEEHPEALNRRNMPSYDFCNYKYRSKSDLVDLLKTRSFHRHNFSAKKRATSHIMWK